MTIEIYVPEISSEANCDKCDCKMELNEQCYCRDCLDDQGKVIEELQAEIDGLREQLEKAKESAEPRG